MNSYPHLSQPKIDYWVNRLNSLAKHSIHGGLELKRKIKGEIALSYFDKKSGLMHKRDRYTSQVKITQDTYKKAITNVNNMESATKSLDTWLDSIAFLISVVVSFRTVPKSIIKYHSAKTLARNNMKLIPVLAEYHTYKPVLTLEESREIRKAAYKLLNEVKESALSEGIKIAINGVTGILEPSFWVRNIYGLKPEEEFKNRQLQIENGQRNTGEIVKNELERLFSKIVQLDLEYRELNSYIDAYPVDRSGRIVN